mgnify:CR=1 FL=1
METYDTLKRDDSFEKFSMDCLEIQEYQQNRSRPIANIKESPIINKALQKYLNGQKVKRSIYVKNRLINLII